MNKIFKIYDQVTHTYNQNRKGIIYEIDNNKNAIDKYLVVWKPTSDYEKENHGYIHDWCNKDELTKY